MKKILVIVLVAVAVLAGYSYWDNYKHRLPELKQAFQNSGGLENLTSEVFTPGPLRSKLDVPGGKLTSKGVIDWTNQRRGENGLAELKENAQLNLAAQAKVKDMFSRAYFDHISPDGKGPADLAKAAGYEYIAVGENLALGNYKDDQALVEAWMNSPGHRANILSGKFKEIGVAVGQGMFEGKRTWLAVQEFGRPVADCPQIDSSLKDRIDSSKAELDALEVKIQAVKQSFEDLKLKDEEDYAVYNQRVNEYNSLVRIYNNKIDILKQLITQYNSQVQIYNNCAK